MAGGDVNTVVEASCPSCGIVHLPLSAFLVRVCVDLNSSAYTFRCPGCGLRASKPADDRTVDVLTAAGVSLELWYLPDELREPHAEGEPVSHDDLLDFHLLLLGDDWFERLEQLVAGTARDVT